LPPGPTSSRAWLYGSGTVQFFFARDPNYNAIKFDPQQFVDRLRALMDSTGADFSAFSARGGKSIMYENRADQRRAPTRE